MSEFEVLTPQGILKCPICDQYPNFFFNGEEYVLDCACFLESHENIMDVKYYWNQLMEKIQDKIDYCIEKGINSM